MFSFIAKTLKVGICTAGLVGLAGAAAFSFAGQDRTESFVREIHSSVMQQIDSSISDPSAARAQLQKMEKEYPKRITEVREDLNELQTEIAAIQNENQVSMKVVALADADLNRMQTEMASVASPDGTVQLVARAVVIGDKVYSLSKAKSRMDEVERTRGLYANRAMDAQHDLLYLQKQEGRLQEILNKLETEQAEFQVQIQGLAREIDAIARNERLIKMLKKRERTIENCSRYEAVSLDQLNGRLGQLRTQQEAELDTLANKEHTSNYEDLARQQLETEKLEARHETYVGEQILLGQGDF